MFVLTATYELRVSRKSHLRDHPSSNVFIIYQAASQGIDNFFVGDFIEPHKKSIGQDLKK
jgi:hypothetical protein